MSVTPNASADASYLLVRNSAGTEIQRVAIDPTESEVSWSGMDKDGYAFPNGRYSFAVENHANGAYLSSAGAMTYTEVVEARRDGG